MRLLKINNDGEISITADLVDKDGIPPYAILSHTWGADTEEITLQDMTDGAGKDKAGYRKIRFCGEQARQDGLQYFWVDTCCINKANKAELSQAIRSMFRWYRNADRCYVYLSDVSSTTPQDSNPRLCNSDFRESRWFSRGWTLQELLAPSTVEFFSQERIKLGDKTSLAQEIFEVTGIPHSALQGASLSQFSINERLRWKEHRHTKLVEDGAYSLSGILDVDIAPVYGEGAEGAFRRLYDEVQKLHKCIQDIHLTDSRNDKKRIEDMKGGLLRDSYCWILEHADFQQWRDNEQSRLLWIKGDPGKGKTMLLCGIINELQNWIAKTDIVSYFFCQATDSRINSATAVLRGLLYLLISQQPSLASHVRRKYDYTGKTMFEDANAWVVLTEIFTNVLQDPSLNTTYLVVDALDECVTDMLKLLDFIAKESSVASRVKWIVSSRNWPDIEEQLKQAGQGLSLELNAQSVSTAVSIFIKQKVSQLAQQKDYDERTQEMVQEHLALNANDTFLWVALVCQNLEGIPRRNVLKRLNAFPPGLSSLYERMMQHINESDDASLCKKILASVAIVFRPVTLDELTTLVQQLEDITNDQEKREIISICGSFLTLREDTVYFVHQSAKDFLLGKAHNAVFPTGLDDAHQIAFLRSLINLSKTLQRDMYNLGSLGYPAEDVKPPDLDPLTASRYSCIYWVDHLYNSNPIHSGSYADSLQVGGTVDMFLREKYLYWLEALSLCKSVPKGILSMAKLNSLIKGSGEGTLLTELIEDAYRFIMYHHGAIHNSPLQAYASALLFSPRLSLISRLFRHEELKWINIQPTIGNSWSACLQTLEGHSSLVHSVAFSNDSTQLASASHDGTIKFWDAGSGECLQTLKGYGGRVSSVAFSHDLTQVASASTSSDSTIKIWDAGSGNCIQTLEGHRGSVPLVAFSHDSIRLASASDDSTVKIWDASNGECLQTLKGHSKSVRSVTFSHNSKRLASASRDRTVKIWDTGSGECLQTLKGHGGWVSSVAFSHDSTRLASTSDDKTVKIWDAGSGECLQTLKGHTAWVVSLVFSHESARLASASHDRTVKVWDAGNGECLQTLKGHSKYVYSVAFSHDSTRLASASDDMTVKIWDAGSGECSQMLEGHHRGSVDSVAFSHNLTRLASGSHDSTVNIWDARSGEYLQTLEGHSDWVISVAFSHDSIRLASASFDGTTKIWDIGSGECLQTLDGHSKSVYSVAFSHDSTRLAAALDDRTIKIWDTGSGECLRTLEGHSKSVRSVAFSHNSKRLASASRDRTVKIWDTGSGECLQTLKGHSNLVHLVAFSNDSKQLVSASRDRTVKIWDAGSGECLQTLECLRDLVPSEACSHELTRLVLTLGDSTDKIWDAGSGGSFDITNSYVHTELGTTNIDNPSSSRQLLNSPEPQIPQYQGQGLSADGKWITCRSENLVWLPSEYRPSTSVVSGDMIGIGAGSGKVWICKFQHDDTPDRE